MTITERIFIILEQKKISQKEFAKEIDVNEKTVSAWKKNNSLPPVDKISKISDCLGVTTDYLLDGEEKTRPEINLQDVGDIKDSFIGHNNISNKTVSENALEIDKLLKSLEHREQIKLMSLIYDWTDKLKKKED